MKRFEKHIDASHAYQGTPSYDRNMERCVEGRYGFALRLAFLHGHVEGWDGAMEAAGRRYPGKWYFLCGWIVALVFFLIFDTGRAWL